MKSKLLNDNGLRTFALIFESEDSFCENMMDFAIRNNLSASYFTAIGAFSQVTLAYFNWSAQEYEKKLFSEQLEVLSLIGDIAVKENKPSVHAHIVLGKSDFSTIGGHLIDGQIRPTLEVILTESPKHLVKKFNEQSKLFLIDIDS